MKSIVVVSFSIFLTLGSISNGFSTQKYWQEINEYVIDPCLLIIVKTLKEVDLTEKESVFFLKSMTRNISHATYRPFIKHLKKMSSSKRNSLYDKFASNCSNFVGKVKIDKTTALKPAKELYREEITKYVIKPCLDEAVTFLVKENMPEKQATAVIDIISKDTLSDFRNILVKQVFGKKLENRKRIYGIGSKICHKKMAELRLRFGDSEKR